MIAELQRVKQFTFSFFCWFISISGKRVA